MEFYQFLFCPLQYIIKIACFPIYIFVNVKTEINEQEEQTRTLTGSSAKYGSIWTWTN